MFCAAAKGAGGTRKLFSLAFLSTTSRCGLQPTNVLRTIAFFHRPSLLLSTIKHSYSLRRCLCATAGANNEANKADPVVSKKIIISYLTDVEGDASYLDRFVRQSKVLTFRNVTTPRLDPNELDYFPYSLCIDFVSDDSVLVYGGDVWDKGGSDLYVIRQLLDLRQRYGPDRVYFIMGNRDLNKMRILQELGVVNGKTKTLPRHGGVYWLRGTGMQGDPLLFENQHDATSSDLVPTNAVERLKWILAKTMGSPNAFELRRKELQSERRMLGEEQHHNVSDDDVVQSYRLSCHPSRGEMGRYLLQANLALRLGNVLFLHGALPLTKEVLHNAIVQQHESPTNTGDGAASNFWTNFDFAMPWRDNATAESNRVVTVQGWIDALNEFARTHLEAWKQNITQKEQDAEVVEKHPDRGNDSEIWATHGGYHHWTTCMPYGPLVQYGMGWTPDGKRNPTVVYSSFLTNGMPGRFYPPDSNRAPEDEMFAKLVREFFDAANLQVLISGHQPHGDMPVPIRIENHDQSSWIFCCDTSYSGDTDWVNHGGDSQERSNMGRGSGVTGRGDVAVSEVLIEQCKSDGNITSVTCHGVLSDGSRYETANLLDGGGLQEDSVSVGQLAPDALLPHADDRSSFPGESWWVKAKFTDGSYLVSSGEGYDVRNYIAKTRG